MTMQKAGESNPAQSTSALARGRAFYQQHAWDDAYAALSEADRVAPLSPGDLEQLGWAAALSGRESELHRTFERLHAEYLQAGNLRRAALVAFWLNTRLVALGEPGQAAGWLGRAQRLLEREAPESCAEQGYLLLPAAQRAMAAGDLAGAEAHARAAIALGERFGDRDLVAFARQLQGRALLRQGQREAGLALLDEVMVAAKAGELAPVLTGIVYCAVISSCQQSFAIERAREWTAALSSWCEAQPQLVVFNGLCLVHRSEVLQLGGSWPEAIAEAERASERCARGIDPPAAALAAYQRAEIHRLRGEGAAAAEAYRAASGRGMEPQPGLALLRLAQGERATAAAAIRRVVEATTDRLGRARYLPAYVEIMLAVDDVAAARAGADELVAIAAAMGAEVLQATAAQADGAVLVAEHQPARAVAPLRQAFELWQRIGAPYLAARARVWLGRACAAAGDPEGAGLQREAARAEFERLGARPDLAALDAETPAREADSVKAKATGAARGLTGRELEVLRLVSQGKTNKEIAQQLGLSEKTVDRHVSNIFGKLDVSTRAAATAYAYQHHLV